MATEVGTYPNWTRHTDYFLINYNTTGVCLSIPGIGGQGCTLISNRHVLLATHVANTFPPLPQTVYFVNNSNVVFTYTITQITTILHNTLDTDISIGYLNTTIDASLSFHKVVPSNFLSYIYTSGISQGIFQGDTITSPYLPVFYMKSGTSSTVKETYCGNLQILDINNPPPGDKGDEVRYVRPIVGARYNNSKEVVGGDSGNIVFITVNNEIVIVGTNWTTLNINVGTGVPGSGLSTTSYISSNITTINTAMTTLAGGNSYSLTQADLSGFKTF